MKRWCVYAQVVVRKGKKKYAVDEKEEVNEEVSLKERNPKTERGRKEAYLLLRYQWKKSNQVLDPW